MIAVVVAVFAFFWLPLYAVGIRAMFVPVPVTDPEFYVINNVLLPPAQWLALSSSTVNPFVYWLFSARFRTGYRDLAARCCFLCCPGRRPVDWIVAPGSSRAALMTSLGSGGPSTYRRQQTACRKAPNSNSTETRVALVAAANNNGIVVHALAIGSRMQNGGQRSEENSPQRTCRNGPSVVVGNTDRTKYTWTKCPEYDDEQKTSSPSPSAKYRENL